MLKQDIRKMTFNNVIGNLAGHAGITYWIKHDLSGIEAGGLEGYISDFIATGLLFPAILAVIFILMYRRKAERGEFEPHEIKALHRSAWLPGNAWLASLVIGLIGLLSVVLPLGAFLAIAGLNPLSPLAVSLTKGVWAAIAAGLIVPVAIRHGVRTANAEPA